MGDPVTIAAISAVGVGATAQGIGTYLGGRQQRNALKTEAAQLETQKKAIETNAAIAQAERLRKLKTVMAAQNAAFAMSGQSSGVGSANAIQAASMDEANREARIQNLQTDIARSAYDYNIWSAKKASHLAMGTAIINSTLDTMKQAGELGAQYLVGKYGGKK